MDSIDLAQNKVNVVASHAISSEKVVCRVEDGKSLLDIIGRNGQDIKIFVNGSEIPPELWHKFKPKSGTIVEIVQFPQGEQVGQVAAVVAVTFIAIYAPYVFSIAGTKLGSAVTAGIMVAGNALISSQFAQDMPKSRTPEQNSMYSIMSVSNSAKPFSVVDKIYGSVWSTPPIASSIYTETFIDKQYNNMLLCLGYGGLYVAGKEFPIGSPSYRVTNKNGIPSPFNHELNLDDIKIGESSLSSFMDWEIEIGYKDDINQFVSDISEDRVDVIVNKENDGEEFIRTTAPNCSRASIDIAFPSGVYSLKKRKNVVVSGSNVSFSVSYSIAGENTWKDISIFGSGSNGRNPFAKTREIVFPEPGQYDIRLIRTGTYHPTANGQNSNAIWTVLRSISSDKPFDIDDVLLMSLRIRASGQISGTIDGVSVKMESLLRDFDENGFNGNLVRSRNPALCYVDCMTGVQNANPIPDDRVNFYNINSWKNWCDSNSLNYDFVHSSDETLLQRLSSIPPVAFAKHSIVNGKFGVVTDFDNTITHVINPRNSISFSMSRKFVSMPNAFRVEFVNNDTRQVDEIICYDDGYDESNSSIYESLQTKGISHPEHAWKYGRYHLAQASLRQETYTIEMDIEQVRYEVGDNALLAYDSMLVGVSWGRIKQVAASILTLDEHVLFEPSSSYSMVIRKQDGAVIEFPVQEAPESNEVLWSQVSGVSVGDLFTFGKSGKVSLKVKVSDISQSDNNMNATVTCVNMAENIFDAWSGNVPDFNPLTTLPVERLPPLPPVISSVESNINNFSLSADGMFKTSLSLSLSQVNSTVNVKYVQVHVRSLNGITEITDFPFISGGNYEITKGIEGGMFYTISCYAVSYYGIRSSVSNFVTIKAFEVSDYVDEDKTPIFISAESGTSMLIKRKDGTIDTRMKVTFSKPEVDVDVVRYHAKHNMVGTSNFYSTYVPGDVTEIIMDNFIDGEEYNIEITAEYKSGIMSDPLVITETAIGKHEPPYEVSGLKYEVSSGVYILSWDASNELDVNSYVIFHDGVELDIVSSTSYVIRKFNDGVNSFMVKALDSTGNQSLSGALIDIDSFIDKPRNVVISSGTAHLIKNQDGTLNSRALISWGDVDGASHYVIRYKRFIDSDYSTVQSDESSIYLNNLKAGSKYNIDIMSVGMVSNLKSDWSVNYHNVLGSDQMPAQVSGFEYRFSGSKLILSWNQAQEVDHKEYEIRRGGSDWDSAEVLDVVKTTSWEYESLQHGQHIFRIKSVDTSQIYSNDDAVLTFVVNKPQPPTNINANVIDNFVLLSWGAPESDFQIDFYEIYKNGIYFGNTYSLFSTVFEEESGEYTFDIYAVDIAGNKSEKSSILTNVSQPPDYILRVNWKSDFTGTKSNCFQDGSTLVLPVVDNETFQQHFLNNGFSNIQEQINAGYPIYIQPNQASGFYEEVFDYGQIIPGTKISVTVTREEINSPQFSVTISTSQDGVTYTDHQGVSNVFVSNFRYVKIKISASSTGDSILIVNDITVKLSAKVKNDGGNGEVTNATNGEVVNFNVNYLDVNSITVSAAYGGSAVSAIYDFVDVPSPTSFKVYLLDNNNNFTTGKFSWSSKGN